MISSRWLRTLSFGSNIPRRIATKRSSSGSSSAKPALVAIDTKDGRVIGSSRFHGYDGDKSEVEIGWTFLARSHWGGRYNGEMKQLMLQHAFRFVDRVVFLVGLHNRRSQRAVEKLGGVRVGSRPGASGRDSIVYEITAATFAPGGPS